MLLNMLQAAPLGIGMNDQWLIWETFTIRYSSFDFDFFAQNQY